MKRRDPVVFRQSLRQLLEAHPPRDDQFQAQFAALREEGHPVYSEALYILTHLSFSKPEARRHWQKVAAHRTSLKQALSRDVGLRVAILDYFVNFNHALKNPKVIELSIYERTERSAVTDGLSIAGAGRRWGCTARWCGFRPRTPSAPSTTSVCASDGPQPGLPLMGRVGRA